MGLSRHDAYQNSGNQLYINDKLEYQYEFKLYPYNVRVYLEMFLERLKISTTDTETILKNETAL
jgi:hypothetical protein